MTCVRMMRSTNPTSHWFGRKSTAPHSSALPTLICVSKLKNASASISWQSPYYTGSAGHPMIMGVADRPTLPETLSCPPFILIGAL